MYPVSGSGNDPGGAAPRVWALKRVAEGVAYSIAIGRVSQKKVPEMRRVEGRGQGAHIHSFCQCNHSRSGMRFWLTKNSELPIHEQLVRQVLLGILSEDLPAGHKLPSVRALSRRHGIHANTVSAAYHDLLERGWLELRHGSGL